MVEKISKKVKDIAKFLELFDEAWQSKELPSPPKEEVIRRVEEIKSSINQHSYILERLFDLKGAGVTHTADMLEYLFTSRLPFLMEEFLKEIAKDNNPKKIRDFYKFWFNFINYLLITNIFAPNKNVDQFDIGTGKYKDKQLVIREVIVRKIFLNLPISIYLPTLFSNIKKNELRELGLKLGLKKEEAKTRKDKLIKIISKRLEEKKIRIKFKEWLNKLSINSRLWKKLTSIFMKYRTPSFLIKNVGLSGELLVLLVLMNEDIGYLIPLLLHQRLFSDLKEVLKTLKVTSIEKYILFPPDFLLLKKGRVIGVELGRGKTDLISTFASVSGLPTAYVSPRVENSKFRVNRIFGYKCNLCLLSYTVCDKFIELFSDGESIEKITYKQTCVNLCGKQKAKSCKDAVVQIKVEDEKSKNFTTEVHYQCLLKYRPDKGEKIKEEELFPLFPKVEGLDKIRLGF
ncbi:MAG: hypothetical protein WBA71_02525 [Candidatus Humimicrobiia bacterium]